jgi:hypothetical protein
MSPTEPAQRDQARRRQARKRQRDREVRLDLQATAIAEQMPARWRQEWLERVKRNRARKGRARVEVEKTLPLIPETAHPEFQARNRTNTKVSIAELRNRFFREKAKIEKAKRDWRAVHYEGGEPHNGDGWNSRYPGSPPISWVEELAARHPVPPDRIDTAAMAMQRAARLTGSCCRHFNLRHPAAPKSKNNSIFFCRA